MPALPICDIPSGETNASLFSDWPRKTPWNGFDVVRLGPGERRAQDAVGAEVGYLVLSGSVNIEQGGETFDGTMRAALVCAPGVSHSLQGGPNGARLVRIAVRCDADSGRLMSDSFDTGQLPWKDAIHGGGGRIGTRHLWGPEDFASSWTFLDHAVLSEGSSLGHHYHDHLEEAFVVLAGRGWMTIGEATVEIGAGQATWHPEGVGHGLHNPFPEDLDFIRIAVAVPGAAFTTIDLDEDLRDRRPNREVAF